MSAAPPRFRPLLLPVSALLACVLAAGALAYMSQRTLASDLRALHAARKERTTVQQRVARLAQEARDMHDHLAIWDRLDQSGIVGEERRLEWLDTLARIRALRKLDDLRYQIEPQKTGQGAATPAPFQVRSSTMKVELALLHEGDLLRFLDDLRSSGGAYYAVRRCTIQRSAAAPMLRGKCEIDLITLMPTKGTA